jgi:GNAT superfamily N-acetyltransferase
MTAAIHIVSARSRPEYMDTLCSAAIRDKKNRAKANFALDYFDHPHTLLWQFHNGIYKSAGFDLGDYMLMFNAEDILMGGAGYYDYDEHYVLAMSRFYVMPGFENQWIGQHFLKEQIKRSIGRDKKMLITFNGYNRRIYDFYQPGMIDKLPPIWKDFKPIGLKTINHVEQYCCEMDIRNLT